MLFSLAQATVMASFSGDDATWSRHRPTSLIPWNDVDVVRVNHEWPLRPARPWTDPETAVLRTHTADKHGVIPYKAIQTQLMTISHARGFGAIHIEFKRVHASKRKASNDDGRAESQPSLSQDVIDSLRQGIRRAFGAASANVPGSSWSTPIDLPSSPITKTKPEEDQEDDQSSVPSGNCRRRRGHSPVSKKKPVSRKALPWRVQDLDVIIKYCEDKGYKRRTKVSTEICVDIVALLEAAARPKKEPGAVDAKLRSSGSFPMDVTDHRQWKDYLKVMKKAPDYLQLGGR